MIINLDNGCYGKSLKVQYEKNGDYYFVNGENRSVTFKLKDNVDLIFCDSVHNGNIVIGKPVTVNLEDNIIILEDGLGVRMEFIEYFGRGF